jgi:hypothetical protein
MTSSALQFGTRIAPDIREASANSTLEARKFKTLGDLLNVWREQPPRQIAMLRSTCVMLASYLDKPIPSTMPGAVSGHSWKAGNTPKTQSART